MLAGLQGSTSNAIAVVGICDIALAPYLGTQYHNLVPPPAFESM